MMIRTRIPKCRCEVVMKIKFISSYHRKTFTKFILENVRNPYSSRYEYIAAVFLLSADKFLWKRAENALTGRSVNFDQIKLKGISTQSYALYKAARSIYMGDLGIALHELGDDELIDQATMFTIFCGVMLLRNGIGLLNWKVKA